MDPHTHTCTKHTHAYTNVLRDAHSSTHTEQQTYQHAPGNTHTPLEHTHLDVSPFYPSQQGICSCDREGLFIEGLPTIRNRPCCLEGHPTHASLFLSSPLMLLKSVILIYIYRLCFFFFTGYLKKTGAGNTLKG